MRRGFGIEPEERVIVAEDVITTGKSAMEVVPLVEAAGANVVAFAAVVDRSRGTFASPVAPAYALCELQFKTWDPDRCPMDRAGIPIDKPGSRPGPSGEPGKAGP
jgi:orotate phosphoribosyltransferase